MLIKSDEATVKITAKVTDDDCRIYRWGNDKIKRFINPTYSKQTLV